MRIMREIIDFHTHPHYDYHEADHGVTIDEGLFRSDLEACGITTACGSVIYKAMTSLPAAEYETMTPKLNDMTFEVASRMKGFYVPGIHIHPVSVEMSCREIDKAADRGCRLLGELVPYMTSWGCGYSDKRVVEILEYARDKDMAVSIHPTDMADMEKMIQAVPHLKLVIAHIAFHDITEESCVELMRRYDNVCYDYSASGAVHEGLARRVIDRVGKDRLLFGTDYPGITPAADIAAIRAEGLTDDELEAVFHGNAKRILGL